MQIRGYYFALEGIDLCGKSTQAKMLAERLQREGWPVFFTKEPGSPHSEITKLIRQTILSGKMDSRCELALFLADRAEHTANVFQTHLENGEIVITDRQWASNVAYQVFGRQVFGVPEGRSVFDQFFAMNDFFCRGLYPDLNIFIDVPVEVAQARARDEKDRSRFDREDPGFHQRVRNGFLETIKNYPKKPSNWAFFYGTKPIAKLHEEIYQAVLQQMERRG